MVALDELNVKMDCVIVAVAHNKFKRMNSKDFLLAQTFRKSLTKNAAQASRKETFTKGKDFIIGDCEQ